MKITREMLEQKKEELFAHREELLGQANACNGALENIEYWLGVLVEPAEPSLSPPEVVPFPEAKLRDALKNASSSQQS